MVIHGPWFMLFSVSLSAFATNYCFHERSLSRPGLLLQLIPYQNVSQNGSSFSHFFLLGILVMHAQKSQIYPSVLKVEVREDLRLTIWKQWTLFTKAVHIDRNQSYDYPLETLGIT